MFQLLFKVGYLCIYEPSFTGSGMGIIYGVVITGVVAVAGVGVDAGVDSVGVSWRLGRHEGG